MPGVVYQSAYNKLCKLTCSLFDCSLPDAEDAIHDACVELLNERNIFHQASIEEMVAAIIIRLRPPHQRQFEDCSELSEFAIEESPEHLYIKKEVNDALIQASKRLTNAQKRTLFQRYIENKSPTEIAQAFKQSSGSVRKRLHDSKQLLKMSLKKAGYDDIDFW